MKRIATRLILTSGFLLILIVWVQSLAVMGGPVAGGSVPAVQYLGESGSFEIDPSQNFLVKPVGRLRFQIVPGPSYTAQPRERVWSLSGDELPEAYNRVTQPIGQVEPGCIVAFALVDDDPDDRLSYFLLNGEVVYTAAQGMVSSGQFIVSEAGTLSIRADDSIGLWVEPCGGVATVTTTPTTTATSTLTPTTTLTPTVTLEPTSTTTPTETLEPTTTSTPDPSATATEPPRFPPPLKVTAAITLQVPSTATIVPTATLTATPTLVPSATPELTPTAPATDLETPTATPTDDGPVLPACLRINFDIGGDHALQGNYVVKEVGGRTLYSWPAEAGWQDSGWIYDIDITFESVYVEVWFYPGDGGEPILMDMLNPAPGTTHGWLSRGECHALEVAWSGGDQFPTPVPGGNLSP